MKLDRNTEHVFHFLNKPDKVSNTLPSTQFNLMLYKGASIKNKTTNWGNPLVVMKAPHGGYSRVQKNGEAWLKI